MPIGNSPEGFGNRNSALSGSTDSSYNLVAIGGDVLEDGGISEGEDGGVGRIKGRGFICCLYFLVMLNCIIFFV